MTLTCFDPQSVTKEKFHRIATWQTNGADEVIVENGSFCDNNSNIKVNNSIFILRMPDKGFSLYGHQGCFHCIHFWGTKSNQVTEIFMVIPETFYSLYSFILRYSVQYNNAISVL